MDKLTREAQEHGEVFEKLTLFKKFVSVLPSGSVTDWIRDFREFLEGYVVDHFRFEEDELFPAVLAIGMDKEKDFIQDLQQEHIRVLDKVGQFKDLSSKCGSEPDEKQINELVSLSSQIIEMITKHAHKEDNGLFPLFKKYHFDLEQSN